jgi:hypothetical protein
MTITRIHTIALSALAGLAAIVLALAALNAAQAGTHSRPLPGWAHWRYLPGYTRDLADCGRPLHPWQRPFVILPGDGDTAALVCPPSKGHPSGQVIPS